jgi:CHAD domain-containing protein
MPGSESRFALDPRRPPAVAVREAARRQLDAALARARRPTLESVHEVRKSCKRLRALLRLLRPTLGRDYALQNRRLRDAGRALAQARDAVVLHETARQLFGKNRQTRAALPAPTRALRLRQPLRAAAQRLRAQRRQLARWPRPSHGELLAGALAGYRRTRRDYRRARDESAASRLHEWRKQLKYHRHQCELVAPLWPRAGRSHLARVKDLADLLGRHHDLHVLEQALRAQHRSVLQHAVARTVREQRHTARRALKLGRKLFEARPLAWFGAE